MAVEGQGGDEGEVGETGMGKQRPMAEVAAIASGGGGSSDGGSSGGGGAASEAAEGPVGSVALGACLRRFGEPEQLDEAESWRCDRCKRPNRAYKQIELWSSPDVLCVHLKRFSSTSSAATGATYGLGAARFNRRRKVATLVRFPPTLDMAPFVRGTHAKSGGGGGGGGGLSSQYALTGVVRHTGDLNDGHYTSVARDAPPPVAAGAEAMTGSVGWANYNDSVVRRVPAETVVSKEAYLLFYQRSGRPMRFGGVKPCADGEWPEEKEANL